MHPFAIYDAFTAAAYSGSQGAIVLEAAHIEAAARARMAREIGVPATAFVDTVAGDRVRLQFFSTVMELPMCGHGTICLITHLVRTGLLSCDGDDWHCARLDLPKGTAVVEYRRRPDGQIEVMLDVAVARFEPADLDLDQLARILGVARAGFSADLPVDMARADFIHLCLPFRDLAAMAKLSPDFPALKAFCIDNGLETVAGFCTETQDPQRHLHVRDFCPAVGVAESAAAGTTNAALAAYALRHGLVAPDGTGQALVLAEQGIELGRPSQITSRLKVTDGMITRLQVGGVAARVLEGEIEPATR